MDSIIDFILEQTNKYSEHLPIIVPTGAIVVLAATVFYTFFIQKTDPKLVAIREEIRESNEALDRIVKSIQLIQEAQQHARIASVQNSTNISLSLREHQQHKINKTKLDQTHEAAAVIPNEVLKAIGPVEEILRIPEQSKSKNDTPTVQQNNNPSMESDSDYSKSSDRQDERLVSHHLLDSTSNLGFSETLDANATILPIVKKNTRLSDQKKHILRVLTPRSRQK